jgi:hypothetical protein
MLYDIIKPQSDAGFGILNSNPSPQAGSGSGTTYVERELDSDSAGKTVPPFWPTLATDDGGETFTFTITDGFVVNHRGGNGSLATSALDAPYYPSGISPVFSGDRTETAITVGQQISVKVALSKDGQVNTVSLVVEDENTLSINPDPTAFAGLGASGEFNYKIAVLRAAVEDAPAYLDYYLAGSHIYLRHRGHNLDQRVYIVTICGGVLANSSNHYLCWRNGDYVGKFLSTDTLPAYTGSLDTDNVTYISAVS